MKEHSDAYSCGCSDYGSDGCPCFTEHSDASLVLAILVITACIFWADFLTRLVQGLGS